MAKLGLLTATVASGLSGGLCLSQDLPLPDKLISEDMVRTNSARLYSDILRTACLSGHQYSADSVRHGFERHYQEYRLGLLSDGYTIILTSPDFPSISQVAFDAKRRQFLPPQFGCHRAYWLDNLSGRRHATHTPLQ